MKHTDPNGTAAADWNAILALLPPPARAAFDIARRFQADQAERLLASHAVGAGGLTTYDPEHHGWIECERLTLETFGECLARCDLYARQRTAGVVDAAKEISS